MHIFVSLVNDVASGRTPCTLVPEAKKALAIIAEPLYTQVMLSNCKLPLYPSTVVQLSICSSHCSSRIGTS